MLPYHRQSTVTGRNPIFYWLLQWRGFIQRFKKEWIESNNSISLTPDDTITFPEDLVDLIPTHSTVTTALIEFFNSLDSPLSTKSIVVWKRCLVSHLAPKAGGDTGSKLNPVFIFQVHIDASCQRFTDALQSLQILQCKRLSPCLLFELTYPDKKYPKDMKIPLFINSSHIMPSSNASTNDTYMLVSKVFAKLSNTSSHHATSVSTKVIDVFTGTIFEYSNSVIDRSDTLDSPEKLFPLHLFMSVDQVCTTPLTKCNVYSNLYRNSMYIEHFYCHFNL